MTLNLNQLFSYCEIKMELFIWNFKKGTASWTLNFLFWCSIFPIKDEAMSNGLLCHWRCDIWNLHQGREPPLES